MKIRLKFNLLIIIVSFVSIILYGCTYGGQSIKEDNSVYLTKENEISLMEIWMYGKQYSPFWTQNKLQKWDEAYLIAKEDLKSCKSDLDFYKLYLKFISILEDGHAIVASNVGNSFMDIGSIPLRFSMIGEKPYLAAKDVNIDYLELGMELISINGVDIDNYFSEMSKFISNKTKGAKENKILELLTLGEIGEEITFTLKDINNKIQSFTFNYTLSEDIKLETFEVKEFNISNLIRYSEPFWLGNIHGINYLSISNFYHPQFQDIFINEVLPHIKNQESIIIDVRNNSGGNSLNGLFLLHTLSNFRNYSDINVYAQNNDLIHFLENISDKIIDKDYDNNSFQQDLRKRIDHTRVVKLEENVDEDNLEYPNKLDINKIIVLSSFNCFSAGEDFLLIASQNPNITIMGENSGGVTGQIAEFILSNDLIFTLTLKDCRDLNNEPIMNRGIQPDIEINRDIQDLIEGNDNQLQEAIGEILFNDD